MAKPSTQHTEHTEAQCVAALLNGTATSSGKAVLVPMSTRIPVHQVAQLEAMASKAGKTRNAMVALVLDAGLEAIRQHLDSATTKELKQLESDALSNLQGEDGEAY